MIVSFLLVDSRPFSAISLPVAKDTNNKVGFLNSYTRLETFEEDEKKQS